MSKMNKNVTVYSKCRAGRRNFLQVEFRGTRSECKRFIAGRARQGFSTHFLFVSSMDRRKATRWYCDGLSWDELGCCWID